MTKEFRQICASIGGTIGTINTWYKNTATELINNTSKTNLRVDKEMCQVSLFHSCTAPVIAGIVVHMSDETGASFDTQVVNGTTDMASMQALLNQWKDCIFMTDFQIIGTGSDETNVFVSNLEADTRRVLAPGQKLLVSVFAMPTAAETSKSCTIMIDNIVWYSAAAQ